MSAKRKPWRKILYENQGYPDYYTDKKTFLWQLERNKELTHVSLPEAIFGTFLLINELCSIIIFTIIYFYLNEAWLDPHVAFCTIGMITGIFYVFYRVSFNGSKNVLGEDIRTLSIFLVFGQLFSPVLHTLTDTISTDTIYTMTFFMLLVHLIFFDYGVPAAIVSNSLSLSAAVFASICLASRLASAYHAFVLITIAIEIFVLFPLFRQKLTNNIYLTTFLITLTFTLLYSVSLIMFVLFMFVVGFIVGFCPVLFVKYQSYKDNIYGPWDEAVVDDADNIINS